MSAKSPMNRLIEAEEIANVIYFLSTDASKSLVGVCVDANAGALMRSTGCANRCRGNFLFVAGRVPVVAQAIAQVA